MYKQTVAFLYAQAADCVVMLRLDLPHLGDGNCRLGDGSHGVHDLQMSAVPPYILISDQNRDRVHPGI